MAFSIKLPDALIRLLQLHRRTPSLDNSDAWDCLRLLTAFSWSTWLLRKTCGSSDTLRMLCRP